MLLLYFSVAFICYTISKLGRLDNYLYMDQHGRLFRKRAFAFMLIALILIIFTGFRHITNAYIDEPVYRNRINGFRSVSLRTALGHSNEFFTSLVFWIASKLSTDSQAGILLSSIVFIIPVLFAFRRYSIDFSFAILMLFANGTLYSSFNGIAQYMATAVFLFSIKYIYERKLLKYTICIFACVMFHNAAIVLFPLYFVLTTRPNSVKAVLINLSIMLLMIIAYRNLGFIIETTGMLTDYAAVVEQGHHGVNFLRIAVNIVPALIVFFLMRSERSDDVTNIIANMCILHAVIMIVSTLDVYIARFSLFTGIFVVLFYSRFFALILRKNSLLIKLVVFLMYSVVTYVTMGKAGYVFNFVL